MGARGECRRISFVQLWEAVEATLRKLRKPLMGVALTADVLALVVSRSVGGWNVNSEDVSLS